MVERGLVRDSRGRNVRCIVPLPLLLGARVTDRGPARGNGGRIGLCVSKGAGGVEGVPPSRGPILKVGPLGQVVANLESRRDWPDHR